MWRGSIACRFLSYATRSDYQGTGSCRDCKSPARNVTLSTKGWLGIVPVINAWRVMRWYQLITSNGSDIKITIIIVVYNQLKISVKWIGQWEANERKDSKRTERRRTSMSLFNAMVREMLSVDPFMMSPMASSGPTVMVQQQQQHHVARHGAHEEYYFFLQIYKIC